MLEHQQVGREVYQGREAASVPSPCVRPELQCLQRASARTVVHAKLSLTAEGEISSNFSAEDTKVQAERRFVQSHSSMTGREPVS